MIDYSQVPSPSFVLDESLLRKNLELIDSVQQQANVTIILAFKGFAMWSVFSIVREYLSGATASSLSEARLCFEEMKVKAHTYSPAYLDDEMDEIISYSSHITFNSITQYQRFYKKVIGKVSCGIRVNPEFSIVEYDVYNPSAPGSRLGEVVDNFKGELPEGIEGLHFHALCESSSYDLEQLLGAFESKFKNFLHQIKWVNFGGGHLMTRNGYDVQHLIQLLKKFKSKYPHLQVILEPGSAIAWRTGDLVSTVLDIVENHGIKTAIMDISFTAHMPDTLEMPYRPAIIGATEPQLDKHLYRIGGISCLSGDFMFEYAFEKPLCVGDKLIFQDMIHYTMVKTTTFNGVTHPNIAIWTQDNKLKIVKKFGYEDYKNRLS
ncbi:MAG: carboxynorspermidine decarboxylase [Saprospiraceae bacterium]